jgi:TFIIB zinc-binding
MSERRGNFDLYNLADYLGDTHGVPIMNNTNSPEAVISEGFYTEQQDQSCLANFCPECGGKLEFDPSSKNFLCKSCGLFASREKIEELRERGETEYMDKRRLQHDAYLEWWQTSKKDKQKATG